ncbi:hypothetical protein COV04_00100 [Candidatus Uhrbacteria bacterium CG10_big_fil_rev_8_21_14_0_10_48_11]|uniref:Thioredoxin domain-containing protein n=1 Tax=Candidatus Uhrbacteria bacterium CG10_big_fil_rev_8_21_14_0_10_48_11 TaxID=1975037 RepID=A0A2M8LFN9_9BACT|nr:MAG: hypothetical protein COV04_00100 [Candidatus Uhrbacteria bacterium CG10_big_fil_rev_8_21_14_0_10_48_11]
MSRLSSRFTIPLIVGAFAVAALLLGYLMLRALNGSINVPSSTTGNSYVTTKDPLITKVQSNAPTLPTARADDFVYGNPNAPVTIFEYSDFACPYCRVMATLLKQAIDENPTVVKLVWRDFPIVTLHPGVENAHLAAWCAGAQGKFWQYHDALFKADTLDRKTFLTVAQKLYLNPVTFASCLDSDTAKAAVSKNLSEGNTLNVDGTPYLFVGDQRISGLLTAEELQQVIDLHKAIAP